MPSQEIPYRYFGKKGREKKGEKIGAPGNVWTRAMRIT